jgi:hypothetical protein
MPAKKSGRGVIADDVSDDGAGEGEGGPVQVQADDVQALNVTEGPLQALLVQ